MKISGSNSNPSVSSAESSMSKAEKPISGHMEKAFSKALAPSKSSSSKKTPASSGKLSLKDAWSVMQKSKKSGSVKQAVNKFSEIADEVVKHK